jgi:hypothetical protein
MQQQQNISPGASLTAQKFITGLPIDNNILMLKISLRY